jgi:hypothetical protein
MARRTQPAPVADPFVEEITRGHAAWRARQEAAMRDARPLRGIVPRRYGAYEAACAVLVVLLAVALLAVAHA